LGKRAFVTVAKRTNKQEIPPPNRPLFDAVVALLRSLEPELRVGSMFGCPAAFVPNRMAFCVYGEVIGVKVPEKEAIRLKGLGKAAAFRRYGRPAMKEWIELRTTRRDVHELLPILRIAIQYAKALDQGA
jgi:hypothetical protein